MKVLKIFDLAFFLIRLSCMMLLLLHIWGYRIPRTLYSISPPSNYRTNAVRKTTHSAVSLLKCVPVKKSPKFPYCTYIVWLPLHLVYLARWGIKWNCVSPPRTLIVPHTPVVPIFWKFSELLFVFLWYRLLPFYVYIPPFSHTSYSVLSSEHFFLFSWSFIIFCYGIQALFLSDPQEFTV